MPRAARIAPKEHIYHILTRGNNRQDIFKDEKDYQKYIEILRRYKERYKFRLYHYVLMKNHVHLVLETTEKSGGLADIMKGINLSYAQHFKNRYKHIGHFWQDRYKSIIISKDNYLLACGSYVELNPVRAKITEDPKDYRWSSYNVYAYGKEDGITDEQLIYRKLSDEEAERRKAYREFVRGMLRDKKAMKGEMDRRVVYGNEDFIREAQKKYEIEAVIKPRGRPKKNEDEENRTVPFSVGFSLLEVIIAVAIMGISVVLIMQLFSGGLRLGKTSGDYTAAVIHAREKMEEMLIKPEAGSGEFDNKYKWQSEVSPYSTAEKKDSKLLKISVKVLWQENKTLELVTLKAAPEENGK